MNNNINKLQKNLHLKKNKIFLSVIIVMLMFCITCIFIFPTFFKAKTPSGEKSKKYVSYQLKVRKGEGMRSIASRLAENKLIKSEHAFYIYSRLKKPVIKAGIYNVSSNLSVKQIIELLSNGTQFQIVISVHEGLTMRRIGQLLEEKDICSKQDFLNSCFNKTLLEKYGLISDKIESFEGFLFPDTYFFYPEMDSDSVVCTMVDNFFEKVSTINGFSKLNLDQKYYVLRLASIVEREYRLPEEAPLIASVFANRLRQNIGLYSCATVEYIITEIKGLAHPDVITYEDLKINSPYNTYKYAGLPPSPISNPGLIALNAACNPPKTSYYFFRLADPKTGKHHFSDNFDEHTEVGRNLSVKKAAGY
ncbi:MAG: endolytic transglycosylase MltG [Treponemataceae bacterium]